MPSPTLRVLSVQWFSDTYCAGVGLDDGHREGRPATRVPLGTTTTRSGEGAATYHLDMGGQGRVGSASGERRDISRHRGVGLWSPLCFCLALGSVRAFSREPLAFSSLSSLHCSPSVFLGGGVPPSSRFQRGGLHVYTSSLATLSRTTMEVRNDVAPVSSSRPPQTTVVTGVVEAQKPAEGAGTPWRSLDPFRPERASVDPIVINVLVKIMTSKADAERICFKAIRKRMQTPETALTAAERRTIFRRVFGVEVLRGRLTYLLEHIVKTSTLTNQRFGPSEPDFGLPMSVTGDPLVEVNRAECLLALYMMTEEKVKVEFLDSDRMEVLQAGLGAEGSNVEANFEAIEDPVDRLAAQRSLPKWIAERWVAQYGSSDADAIAAKLNELPPTTIRVNTMKTVRGAVMDELAKRGISSSPTRLSPWGVQVDLKVDDPRIMDQDIYKSGNVDLLSEASQCVSLATAAKAYDIVLVFGAKKGCKALALASMMRGNGMIYLWEPYERQRAQIAETIKRGELSDLVEILPNINSAMRIKADVVLVDALCSNTGALSHHPSLRWFRNETVVVDALVSQQKNDLQSAARAVSPGGVLVYSTCSLLAEENEQVADWFEANYGEDFEPMSFDKSPSGGNRRLLLPHIHGVDGTFIARWRRRAREE